MEFDFKRLHKIPTKTKNIVFGYIRSNNNGIIPKKILKKAMVIGP